MKNDILHRGWTEELLANAITAKCILRAFRNPENIHFSIFYTAKKPIAPTDWDMIRRAINKGGRFDKYMEYLRYEISYFPIKNQETIDFHVDIGAVIFLEYVVRDIDGDAYKCEPMQFYLLLDPSMDSVKTITRRGSKTFSDRVPAFRDCITNPGFKIQVTEQSMTTAKLWLDDLYMWWWRSRLIQEWSGGDLEKDSVSSVKFRNRSEIIVHTAANIESLSGIGVHKQIYDEKSLYTSDTARARITARGQKKKKGRSRITFRTAGTPFGDGTDFHKDQINLDKWQYFAPLFCPMGFEKPICYDCDYYTQTKYRRGEIPSLESLECTAPLPLKEDGSLDLSKMYRRIPEDRYSDKEILEDHRDLTKEMWMQEFMCATIEYSGTAFSLELIHAVVDEELEKQRKSELDCYVGVDFGQSEIHRSAIVVVGIEGNGVMVNLNTIILPAGTPYRTRDSDTEDHRAGVVEEVLKLFRFYPNIKKIVADATGVGKDYVERDLVDLCMKHNGFSNVVPFKISGESKGPLWSGTVKPAMELGRVKTYPDRQLYLQMRAWRSVYNPATHKTKLIPPKVGEVKSDDALIAWFLALHGALNAQTDMARSDVLISGIKSHDAYGLSVFEKGGLPHG